MHLALAIGGMTLEEMDERMSEREFRLWLKYADTFFLPERRAELQAAQTAYLVAASIGGGKRKLADFVVLPKGSAYAEPEPDAEYGGMVLGAMTSRRVIQLGKKKRDNGG